MSSNFLTTHDFSSVDSSSEMIIFVTAADDGYDDRRRSRCYLENEICQNNLHNIKRKALCEIICVESFHREVTSNY